MSPAVLSNGNGHTDSHPVTKAPAYGFSTRAVHVGSEPDAATGAVIPAISLSTTYQQTAVGVHKVSVCLCGGCGSARASTYRRQNLAASSQCRAFR